MNEKSAQHLKSIRNVLIIVVVTLIIYYAGGIVMPILFSAFIALILSPVQKRMEKWGFPKILAVLVAVICMTLLFSTLLLALSYESQKILSSLPQENMEKVLDESSKVIEESVGTKITNLNNIVNSSIEKLKDFLISSIPMVLVRISNTLVFFFTCPIYVFFMLMYRQNLRGFYYESLPNEDKKRGNQLLIEVENAFGSYIKGMLMVITIISTLTGLGLWALGLDYALFLGVLAGLLSLIPYIGIIVSALIPMILAIITKDSLWYVAGVFAVFAVVQFVEGNIITPKIVGNKVDVNPLFVILGIVIFGAVGGITGMVLTIPFLALIKIISTYLPEWKPIEKLLQA